MVELLATVTFIFFYVFLIIYHVIAGVYVVKAMIIIAWNGSGNLSTIFEGNVFKKVLSIFITAAILKLAQGKHK